MTLDLHVKAIAFHSKEKPFGHYYTCAALVANRVSHVSHSTFFQMFIHLVVWRVLILPPSLFLVGTSYILATPYKLVISDHYVICFNYLDK